MHSQPRALLGTLGIDRQGRAPVGAESRGRRGRCESEESWLGEVGGKREEQQRW